MHIRMFDAQAIFYLMHTFVSLTLGTSKATCVFAWLYHTSACIVQMLPVKPITIYIGMKGTRERSDVVVLFDSVSSTRLHVQPVSLHVHAFDDSKIKLN